MILFDNENTRNLELEKLILKTQDDLADYLESKVKIDKRTRMWLYHKGTVPILLCCHLDTVHKERARTMVYANNTLSSPQGIGGDDRCGVYMCLEVLKEYDCHVVFLYDEEIGCVGAHDFARSATCSQLDVKFIVEFDRKGPDHAVFYDCDNESFEKFVTKEFFQTKDGTCSDISYIAPACGGIDGTAAVNLSCGYYDEHNIFETIRLDEMYKIISEAKRLIREGKDGVKFKYVKKKSTYNYWSSPYQWGFEYLEKNDDGTKTSSYCVIRDKYSEDAALAEFVRTNTSVPYEDIIKFEKL